MELLWPYPSSTVPEGQRTKAEQPTFGPPERNALGGSHGRLRCPGGDPAVY
jgi:hypothetical protein